MAVLHVGKRFRTTTSQSIQSGLRLRTPYNKIIAGKRFRSSYGQVLQVGAKLKTHIGGQAANKFFGLGALASVWAAPTYSSSNKGSDDPTIVPEVIITSFRVVIGNVPTPQPNPSNLPPGSSVDMYGNITYPSGSSVASDGTITYSSGNIYYPDGTTYTPGTDGGYYSYNQSAAFLSGNGLNVTGSFELAPFIKTLTLDMHYGAKWSFNAVFEELNGIDSNGVENTPHTLNQLLATLPSDLNPLYYGKNSYANSIFHHKFDMTRQIIIKFKVGFNGDYQEFTTPPFSPGVPHFDGYTLTWAGEDITTVFEQEYQTMKDITAKSVSAYMAQETIMDIGRRYGFTNFNFQFPNYRIRELRRQKGKPIDWIDKIVRPYQAFRNWEGGMLTFRPAPNPDDVNAAFIIQDFMIEEGSYSVEFNNDWKNKFTLARLKDQGGMYGDAQCTGGHCIGRTLKLTFSEPLNNVDLHTETVGPAYLHTYTWFDSADRVLDSTVLPSYRGPFKAARVEATFEPTWNQVTASVPTGPFIQNVIPYTADYGYSVFAYGGNTSGVFSSSYTFKYQDATTIAAFGLRPDNSNIEDVIIPDRVVAQAYLAAVVKHNLRRVWKMTLSTRYCNPLIIPNTVIGVVDYLTLTGTVRWLVEKVNYSWDDYGNCIQKLECYRGILV